MAARAAISSSASAPPIADAKPYGIKIDALGTPWVACNGSNCLVKVGPATMELTEVKLPDAETTELIQEILHIAEEQANDITQGAVQEADRLSAHRQAEIDELRKELATKLGTLRAAISYGTLYVYVGLSILLVVGFVASVLVLAA